MKNFYIFLLSFTFLFTNCATTNKKPQVNPFKKFFKSGYSTETLKTMQNIKTLRATLEGKMPDSIKYSTARAILEGKIPDNTFFKTPKLYVGNLANGIQDIETMIRENYISIGFSMFNGGEVNPEEAVVFGEELGADYVLVYSSYSNTISGTLPITSPSTKTETTRKTGNVTEYGNIYGIDESASFSGDTYYSETSTKATQENKTTYFPYSVDRYNYTAVYFVENPRPIFLGINFTDLPLEVRKKIGSNKGVIVTNVIKGSPAFMADILEDDIIRKIDSFVVIDSSSLYKLLDDHAGENVKLEIIRDNKTIIKEVQLNENKYTQ